MGRNKEPISNIVDFKGNVSHKTHAEIDARKQAEESFKPASDAITSPKWLNAKSKKEFKIIVENLKEFNLVTNIDVSLLALWADAYAEYQDVNRIIKSEGLMVEYTNKGAETSRVPHPLLNRKKALVEIMDKIGKQFGLSPAARLDIVLPRKNKDGEKPKTAEEKLFGGI